MSSNQISGETEIVLGGIPHRLQYTWSALAKMQDAFPDGERNLFDPKILSKVLRFGLEAHHPEITEDDILRFSPPLVPTIGAVNKSVEYAMWGPEGPPRAAQEAAVPPPENPPKATPKKKGVPATA